MCKLRIVKNVSGKQLSLETQLTWTLFTTMYCGLWIHNEVSQYLKFSEIAYEIVVSKQSFFVAGFLSHPREADELLMTLEYHEFEFPGLVSG